MFNSILKEICEEENIKLSFISDDWIKVLEKDDKVRIIAGYKFDVITHGIGQVLDDKYALFSLLTKDGYEVVEHRILFKKDNIKDNVKYVRDYFCSHNSDIVLKVNKGTCGNNILHITNEIDIENSLVELFNLEDSISLCPFYNIKNEYRFVMLDGECLLCHGKQKPTVVGDGKKSIEELLLDFNRVYFSKIKFDNSFKRILKDGEVFEYSWMFNLSQGSMCFDILDVELQEKMLKIAKDIGSRYSVGFCSVDIIHTFDDKLLVMELNSGVMLKNYAVLHENGKEIVKEVYRKAIKKMFDV